jgi:hypothetical protein
MVLAATVPATAGDTAFSYGGYFKLDVLSTYYRNGDVASGSPLRDFHLPSQIPVGEKNENYDLDFHAKESRFHFQTLTPVGERKLRGFLEFDFLLSKQGDEKVSNSFNPRLRHVFFEYGDWLFGQTWTNFMIIVLPEDLDFAGASEGIVFGRQPQIRWSPGPWRISLENPETTVSIDEDGSPVSVVTESGRLPDLVVHREFAGDWGSLGVALIGRQLYYKGPDVTDPTRTVDDQEFGFGLSAGTRIKVGQRDEVLAQATAGQGLGRYAALNYVNSAALDEEQKLHTIELVCGFVGYRHWWNEKWRSSVNVSLFTAENPASVTGGGVNKEAQSYSINLLYSPIPKLTFGGELMHARRVLQDGTDGAFDRLQLSARYDFGYSSDQDVREKK